VGNSDAPRWPGARIAIATVLALVICLLAASRVAGHHSFNAVYTGMHSGGGTVEFNVNADGTLITRYKLVDVPCEDPAFTYDVEATYSAGGISIAGHAFNMQELDESFSGSFPQNQSATGSYQARDTSASGCVTQTVSWNATTSTPPPHCADGVDNDADGKIDLGADPGCSNSADNDETDPPDTTAPTAALSGKKTQKAGRSVKVDVSCPDESCTAKGSGSVSVPRVSAARRFTLRAATAQIPSGGKATLRLKIPRRVLGTIKRALRGRAKVKARLKVSVVDVAGNRTVKRRTIRLTG
jgi:hypothetical protein